MSVRCDICGAEFDTHRGLNGHMNAHIPKSRQRRAEDIPDFTPRQSKRIRNRRKAKWIPHAIKFIESYGPSTATQIFTALPDKPFTDVPKSPLSLSNRMSRLPEVFKKAGKKAHLQVFDLVKDNHKAESFDAEIEILSHQVASVADRYDVDVGYIIVEDESDDEDDVIIRIQDSDMEDIAEFNIGQDVVLDDSYEDVYYAEANETAETGQHAESFDAEIEILSQRVASVADRYDVDVGYIVVEDESDDEDDVIIRIQDSDMEDVAEFSIGQDVDYNDSYEDVYYAEADETSDEEDEVCEICEHYGMLCQGCASYYGMGPLTKGYKKDMGAESFEEEYCHICYTDTDTADDRLREYNINIEPAHLTIQVYAHDKCMKELFGDMEELFGIEALSAESIRGYRLDRKPSKRVSVEGVRHKAVRKFWKDIFSAENWEGQPRDIKGRWITVHTKPKEGLSQTPDTEDLEALAEAINIVDPTFPSIETLLSMAGGDSEETRAELFDNMLLYYASTQEPESLEDMDPMTPEDYFNYILEEPAETDEDRILRQATYYAAFKSDLEIIDRLTDIMAEALAALMEGDIDQAMELKKDANFTELVMKIQSFQREHAAETFDPETQWNPLQPRIPPCNCKGENGENGENGEGENGEEEEGGTCPNCGGEKPGGGGGKPGEGGNGQPGGNGGGGGGGGGPRPPPWKDLEDTGEWVNTSTGEIRKSKTSPGGFVARGFFDDWRPVKRVNLSSGIIRNVLDDIARLFPTKEQIFAKGLASKPVITINPKISIPDEIKAIPGIKVEGSTIKYG